MFDLLYVRRKSVKCVRLAYRTPSENKTKTKESKKAIL